MYLKNNNFALGEHSFVIEAITDLLDRGLVKICTKRPTVVDPLTVSVQSNGEKRLILDLRLVNKHLWKQSINNNNMKI